MRPKSSARWWGLVLAGGVLAWSLTAMGQATRPSATLGEVQLRALQAFDRGEYALALPLLQKLAAGLQDEPQRLGAVEERIRVCERNLKTAATQPSGGVEGADHRVVHPAPKPGEVLEMSIKDLGNFDYDPQVGGNIPADVLRLSGAKLRLRGFMIPMDQADRVRQFALVPSLTACCYGQPPQIQHTVVVSCPAGKSVAYTPDEIVVEGMLTVQEKKDDGFIISLFELAATSVKAAE